MKHLGKAVFVSVCLVSSWASGTSDVSSFRQPAREPSWVFVAGPGTIVSVRMRDLPFTRPQYTVMFKTDTGEKIELWHPDEATPVREGMHGTLIYSTHPDKIIDFRIAARH